jgi:hypothetical protein
MELGIGDERLGIGKKIFFCWVCDFSASGCLENRGWGLAIRDWEREIFCWVCDFSASGCLENGK